MNKSATQKSQKPQLEKLFYRQLAQDITVIPNLLLRYYKEMGLSNEELITMLCVLSIVPKDRNYFTLHDLALFSNMEGKELPAIIKSLADKGLVHKVKNEPVIDAYTIEGLYDKLFEVWVYIQACPAKPVLAKPVRKKNTPKDLSQIYNLFEGEFGRPLSPTEGEKITFWLVSEGWDPLMVKEALTRAVIHGACNLVYIDRILERWRKEGIRELGQLKAESTANEKKRTTKRIKKNPKVMCSGTNYEDAFK